MAAVECELDLFRKVQDRGRILIGYSKCRIDASLQIMRCLECRLFRHTNKNCSGLPTDLDTNDHLCLDCRVYNLRVPKFLQRDTRYPAASRAGQTRRNLVKKYIQARITQSYADRRLEAAMAPL